MRASFAGLLVALLVPIISPAAGEPPAGADDGAACRAVSPPVTVSWVTDAAWTHGGRLFSLVDRNAGAVHQVDPQGRRAGAVHRPGPPPEGLNEPLAVQGTAEGLVVQDGLGRFVWLDSGGEPTRVVDLAGRGFVLQFAEDGNDSGSGLVAFGRWLGEEVIDGFFRVDLAAAEPSAGLLLAVPRGGAERTLYSLLRPVFAVVAGEVYALRFDGGPRLVELAGEGRARPLDAFPEGFHALPTLPAERGPAAVVSLYQALRRARVPVHLAAFRDRLFVVTREPGAASGDGAPGTRWTAHRIDPVRDRLESSLTLPSTAAHLRLVPGDPWWAALEFGPVAGVGDRPLERLVFLPADWFVRGDSPLAAGDKVDCAGGDEP